ncbi:DUF4097 family beta strand repeat protein [Thermobifida halotolerans]|uniref:DUF4097 family beta strand repeat protein n=1 Tax=Thermobifida halotolerans TaxID=483545 RepID=A0A399FZ82_9ACTN|nr:DUF4097 family beta strand repeat-containing protein [Thermobifida halotolerans]UOE19403.1 DUF4097 family beta strand repeat protein [Thermobifida halotolerans]
MTFTARGLYASSSKVPRKRQWRHGWLLIGAIVGLVALALGVLSVLNNVFTTTATESQEFPAPVRVEIDNRTAGNVTVIAGEGDSVTVASRTYSSLTADISDSAETRGDGLRVEADCTGILSFGHCAVDYLVTVPVATEVSVATETGNVEVTGITADVDVDTGTGNIRMADVTGRVTLETDIGDITAEGSGPAVTATTDTGGINLEFFEAAEVEATTSTGDILIGGGFEAATALSSTGSVYVDTDTEFRSLTAMTDIGNVELRVPDSVYRVVGGTHIGTETVEVDRSPDADSVIEARSDTGSITISPN